jgi:hypothetical protein
LGVPLQLFLNHKKHNIDMENNPMNAGAEAKCPFTGATAKATYNQLVVVPETVTGGLIN